MTSSPLSPSGRRLVSRNLTFGQAARRPCNEVADRGEEVFAVVEHQQRGAVGDVVGERVDPPRPVGRLQAQRLGDRRGPAARARRRPPSGTTQHPSRYAAPLRSAIRRATRVFPTPPGPTSVTTRDDAKVLANVGQQRPPAHERRVEGGCLDGLTLVARVHASRRLVGRDGPGRSPEAQATEPATRRVYVHINSATVEDGSPCAPRHNSLCRVRGRGRTEPPGFATGNPSPRGELIRAETGNPTRQSAGVSEPLVRDPRLVEPSSGRKRC